MTFIRNRFLYEKMDFPLIQNVSLSDVTLPKSLVESDIFSEIALLMLKQCLEDNSASITFPHKDALNKFGVLAFFKPVDIQEYVNEIDEQINSNTSSTLLERLRQTVSLLPDINPPKNLLEIEGSEVYITDDPLYSTYIELVEFVEAERMKRIAKDKYSPYWYSIPRACFSCVAMEFLIAQYLYPPRSNSTETDKHIGKSIQHKWYGCFATCHGFVCNASKKIFFDYIYRGVEPKESILICDILISKFQLGGFIEAFKQTPSMEYSCDVFENIDDILSYSKREMFL